MSATASEAGARLTERQVEILRRLANGEPGREGLGDGLHLMLCGLTDLDARGTMHITPAGRAALATPEQT